jgi:hypothetical protein
MVRPGPTDAAGHTFELGLAHLLGLVLELLDLCHRGFANFHRLPRRLAVRCFGQEPQCLGQDAEPAVADIGDR